MGTCLFLGVRLVPNGTCGPGGVVVHVEQLDLSAHAAILVNATVAAPDAGAGGSDDADMFADASTGAGAGVGAGAGAGGVWGASVDGSGEAGAGAGTENGDAWVEMLGVVMDDESLASEA